MSSQRWIYQSNKDYTTAIDTTYNTLYILYKQDYSQSWMDYHSLRYMKKSLETSTNHSNSTKEWYPIFYYLESEWVSALVDLTTHQEQIQQMSYNWGVVD